MLPPLQSPSLPGFPPFYIPKSSPLLMPAPSTCVLRSIFMCKDHRTTPGAVLLAVYSSLFSEYGCVASFIYVCHVCAQYLWRPEVWISELELQVLVSCHCSCWELNLVPLQEQYKPPTIHPSLRPSLWVFNCHCKKQLITLSQLHFLLYQDGTVGTLLPHAYWVQSSIQVLLGYLRRRGFHRQA